MKNMFSSCTSFNQPLNEWNVSNVTSMSGMFAGCSSFNQPLDKWTVDKVNYMSDMFKGCSSFNQPLGTWKIKKAIEGLYTTAMSPSNYSQTLVGWAAQTDIVENVEFNEEVRDLIYNDKGKEARDKLRSKGWVFKKDIHKVGGVSLTPHTLSLALNKEVTLPLDKWGVEEAEEVALSTDMEGVISNELTEDKKGVRIKGIKTGMCTLTATIAAKEGEGGHVAYTSTCVVNVYIPIEDITITPNSKTLKVGQQLTLKADIIPANATDQEVHWYTSPKYIVEVDSNTGQVTARMAGKCTISVKKEEHGRWFIKTYPLIVVDEIAPVTRIALVQTSRTIKVGATTQLVGVVFPDKAEQGLVWSSSAPQIATVSDGVVVGKKVGSCTITAESRDPRYTQKHECKIIVEPSGNETFLVTLSPAEHGSIKIENKDENALAAVAQGTELTVTVTPDAGYKLKRLKANEEDITTTCKFIVMDVTVVTAEFEKKTFAITQDIQGTGSLTFIDANNQVLDPSAIPYETVVKVVPEVSGSWELISLMLNNEDISTSKSFVLKDNVMLHAIFQDKSVPTFEVTVTQTAGGTIAIPKYPTAVLKSVSKGTTLTVITTPDEGYELKSLKAGDVDITTTKQFTVTANTEVKAVFEKPTFSVTLTQPANGKLEIEGYATQTSITVAKGAKLTIKATPETGYKLKEIVVNSQKLDGTTFVVTTATTVTAVFEKETFAVTTSVNNKEWGDIAISGASDLTAVPYDTELTVTITEKEGYKLKELKANDEDITAIQKFTVKAETTVTALFESKQGDNNKPGAVEDALLAGIAVAPNPFTAQLRILNPEGVTARYELVNAAGVVVRSGALSEKELVVDTEALPSDIYFVRLEAQNGARKSLMVSK